MKNNNVNTYGRITTNFNNCIWSAKVTVEQLPFAPSTWLPRVHVDKKPVCIIWHILSIHIIYTIEALPMRRSPYWLLECLKKFSLVIYAIPPNNNHHLASTLCNAPLSASSLPLPPHVDCQVPPLLAPVCRRQYCDNAIALPTHHHWHPNIPCQCTTFNTLPLPTRASQATQAKKALLTPPTLPCTSHDVSCAKWAPLPLPTTQHWCQFPC